MKRKTIDIIITITMVAFTLGLLILSVSAASIALDIHQQTRSSETAWDAPWVNVIERGPVQ